MMTKIAQVASIDPKPTHITDILPNYYKTRTGMAMAKPAFSITLSSSFMQMLAASAPCRFNGATRPALHCLIYLQKAIVEAAIWEKKCQKADQGGQEMAIRVCVAGVSGWTGSEVARAILHSGEFQLSGAIARQNAGRDAGEFLGLPANGVIVAANLEQALSHPADVLVDFTSPDSVKQRTLEALARGLRVVIGTSGLTATDYADIERTATENGLGVIAAGNFSITAALAKHFALLAAKHLPSWEIIDYAHAEKPDAPSGTTRELAEALGEVAQNKLALPVERTHGEPKARGATIAGTQVHSIRLPGIVLAFETIFGLPNERLTLRHDAGKGADPYVNGTLLAVRRVMLVTGLVRGLDRLLFGE
jgi:4-hydroxy-tetrahydrodipicolinate reductase